MRKREREKRREHRMQATPTSPPFRPPPTIWPLPPPAIAMPMPMPMPAASLLPTAAPPGFGAPAGAAVTLVGEYVASGGGMSAPQRMAAAPPGGGPVGEGQVVGSMGGELNGTVGLPIPRDRKKHKCAVCGNITRAKCNFRACKNCCVKARNPCSVHKHLRPKSQNDLSESVSPLAIASPFIPQWSASTASIPSKTESYVRPAVGYPSIQQMALQKFSPQMSLSKVPSRAGIASPLSGKTTAPAGPPTKPSWLETAALKEKELLRSNNLKAWQASQREAALVNAWRFQKVKEHIDAELTAEDEAFDRYMQNASMLEETFSSSKRLPQSGDVIDKNSLHPNDAMQEELAMDGSELLDAMKARLDANVKRRDSSRQKLKRAITKSLQKMKRGESAADGYVDADATSQFYSSGLPRDIKRMKVRSKKGKDCLERLKAWDSLLQSIDAIKKVDDVCAAVDTYRDTFGNCILSFFPDMIQVQECEAVGLEKIEEKDTDSALNVENTETDRRYCKATLETKDLPSREDVDDRAGYLLDKVSDVDSSTRADNHNSLQVKEHEHEEVPQTCLVSHEIVSPLSSATKKINVGITRSRTQNHVMLDYRKYVTGMGWWRVQNDEAVAQETCKSLSELKHSISDL